MMLVTILKPVPQKTDYVYVCFSPIEMRRMNKILPAKF